jgi:hypothetical protein
LAPISLRVFVNNKLAKDPIKLPTTTTNNRQISKQKQDHGKTNKTQEATKKTKTKAASK